MRSWHVPWQESTEIKNDTGTSNERVGNISVWLKLERLLRTSHDTSRSLLGCYLASRICFDLLVGIWFARDRLEYGIENR